MSRVYTIAETANVCHGHGDYVDEQKITREGAYCTGEFPPLFTSKTRAEIYLKSKKMLWGTWGVVSLNIRS